MWIRFPAVKGGVKQGLSLHQPGFVLSSVAGSNRISGLVGMEEQYCT